MMGLKNRWHSWGFAISSEILIITYKGFPNSEPGIITERMIKHTDMESCYLQNEKSVGLGHPNPR